MPKSRVEFWRKKFEANVERDERNVKTLIEEGWRVAIVWECTLKGKDKEKLDRIVCSLEKWMEEPSASFLELP
jgi:DNA mismatch endonuclease (patch repair protein)